MKIKLIKFENFYKAPSRQHYDDAGADVYAIMDIVVKAGTTATIPLGFGLELPNGYMGMMIVRSGQAKLGLNVGMCPIDSGYRGEVHAIIYNNSNTDYVIHKGDRIAQLVVVPTIICDFVDDLGPTRNLGAFNSTGK